MSGTVGQFVRALVEVDMSQTLLNSVHVGCGDSSFLVELVYENLPFFCSSCNLVGHSLDRCHKNIRKEEAENQKKGKDSMVDEGRAAKKQTQPAGKEEWRKKGDTRRSRSPAKKVDFTSNNRFQPLDDEEEDREPNMVDVLERVTVPADDEDASVTIPKPRSRLEDLERRMQADVVVEQVVRSIKEQKGGNSGSGQSLTGLDLVKDKLAKASRLGANPTELELHKGGGSSLEVMNHVARQVWDDDVNPTEEDEDSGGFSPENLGLLQ